MSDPQLRNIVNELIKLNQKLDRMNTNHVEIGRLFKTWFETEPEEVTIEEMDREPFVVGQIVRVTNINSTLYKYVGKIVAVTPSGVQVKFMLGEEVRSYFNASGLEILPQPELHEGDLVRDIDPMSMVYMRIGKVIDPNYDVSTVAVEFGEMGRTAGEIERRHLELVSTRGEALIRKGVAPFDKFKTDSEGRLLPWQWRHNLAMDTFFDASAVHEQDLMTEEAFRIYNAGEQPYKEK